TGGLELARALECYLCFVGRPESSGPTEEPRDILREHIQHFARCLPTRDALCIGGKNWKIPIPPCRKVASLHQFDLIREIGKLFAISRDQLRPLRSGVLAAFANTVFEMAVDAIRHEKLRVFGPAIKLFHQADFIVTKRFTVSFGSVLFVRG